MTHRIKALLLGTAVALSLQAQDAGRVPASTPHFEVDTLVWNGPKAINFVFTGEGFTADEQGKLTEKVQDACHYLFEATPPFCYYRDWFNILLIHAISNESGISHPQQTKRDWMCRGLEKREVDTYFKLSYDQGGIHRLLSGPWGSNKCVHPVLNSHTPGWQVAGVVANCNSYGGSGGDKVCVFSTCTDLKMGDAREIFVHELGHAFADLADEYNPGDNYLEELANQTHRRNVDSLRWKHWMGTPFQGGTVGTYPLETRHGKAKEWLKPVDGTCKMERLGKEFPFCPVCSEAIIEEIHRLVPDIILEASPASTDITCKGRKLTFAIQRVMQQSGKGSGVGRTSYQWSVDGQPLAKQSKAALRLKTKAYRDGQVHTVKVLVRDESPLVRNPKHQSHTSERTWTFRME